jgi:hypothetical protein
VEVKIPRERISLQEVPEHEYGAYFGLSGIPQKVILPGFPEPFIFSNVPAAGKQTGGIFGSGDVSGNLVTNENFTETLNDNLVIRQVLKRDDEDTPEDKRTFIITSATIKENTESLYVNGIIQAVGDGNDYTITGQQIIFEYDILDSDSIYITYIVN